MDSNLQIGFLLNFLWSDWLLLGGTIVPTTYWGSWTLITWTNAYRCIIEQHLILFESLVWVDDDTFFFQQRFKVTNNLYHLQHVCLLPFEQPIGQQIDQFQDSILKHLHHHTFSTMLFEKMFNAHQTHTLSYFGLGASTWLTTHVIPCFNNLL